MKIAQKLRHLDVHSVLEIGPGNGILTRELLRLGLNVLAVEKDSRFAEKLTSFAEHSCGTEQYPGMLTVVNEDVLKFDLSSWLDRGGPTKAICGNIPYNISSPILLWLLPHIKRIEAAFLLVQLEFAERVASSPKSKSYGSLSVFTQLRAIASIEFRVARTCFYPVPRVDSAAVYLVGRDHKLSSEQLARTEKLTRQAFSQRRKKLSNSLSPFLKDTDPKHVPLDLSRRCDSLSPEEFVHLADALIPPAKKV